MNESGRPTLRDSSADIGPGARNRDLPASIRTAWAVMFAFFAAAAALLPGIDNRIGLVALLLGLVPVQLVWHRIAPSMRVSATRPLHDSAVCLFGAMVEPNIWMPAVVIYAVSATDPTLSRLPRATKAIAGAIGVGLACVGILSDQPFWPATVAAVVGIIGLRSMTGETIWRRVEENERKHAELLDSISAVVLTADPDRGVLTWVSPNISRIVGWSAEEWMTRDPKEFIHPDDLESFWIEPDELEVDREYVRLARHSHKDGGWVWLNMVNRLRVDAQGVRTLYGHCIDATDIVAEEAVMQTQARVDPVTGLSNRYVLIAELEARLAGPVDEGFALLMLDVDRFKEINDSLGHSTGDAVLRELADRITRSAPDELVCRLGGDEFAVLIDDPIDVDRIVHDIGDATSAPMKLGDLTVSTQVSIGSVTAPADADTNEDVLRRGDMAMYQAKRRGQLHLAYVPEMEHSSALDLELSASLASALENEEFELSFQPKVDLRTRTIVGAEGLIRWNNPKHGVLRPAAFMHLIMLSNSHGAFADLVIRQAVTMARVASTDANPFSVAVNVSMVSLFDQDFAQRVATILAEEDLHPSQLTIEITESDIMEEYAIASEVIAQLAELGVCLSIDDFGTGYSSFARLVDLPVSEIKIDRRFVDAAPSRQRERAVVDSIVDLARRLDLHVVAEGIESREQADVLIEAGCYVGQGFLFSHAVRSDELLAKLATVNAKAADRS